MKKEQHHLKYVLILTILLSILLMVNFLEINHKTSLNTFNDNQYASVEEIGQKSSEIPDNVGGYDSYGDATFKTIQNSTSLISKRNFLADPNNEFNITTPDAWNVSSMGFNINPYSRNQTIRDPFFDQEYNFGTEYWDTEKVQSGFGTFTQYDLASYPYARTNIYNLKERSSPSFYEGDHAYWTTDLLDLNPKGYNLERGRIIQEEDEKIEDYDQFRDDPEFFKDLESPYGGRYDPAYDLIELFYDETTESLKTLIDPGVSSLGGNPSAAWWYYTPIPYQPDYAQMKITWSIDPESTFEAEDNYQVIARINNKYINGKNVIAQEGELPFNGSETALMVYNGGSTVGHIHHGTISRTYNITNLVDGLLEFNKFDFGVWAANASHAGDQDLILANFESVEFMINTSAKYEVALLQYQYKLLDEDLLGNNPFKNTDDASLVLSLRDLDTSEDEFIELLPFSRMEVSKKSFLLTPWKTMNFSLSQEYEEFLKADNLEFKIGVYFNNEFYEHLDFTHYLDNLFFVINYKKSIQSSRVQIRVDGTSTWDNVSNNYYLVDTSSWSGGENHGFEFRTMNSSLDGRLFLNFLSTQQIYYHSNSTHEAVASYSIDGANAALGNWYISYDNTFPYNKLLSANATMLFNLSYYSLSYINMPAFDLNGSHSKNWDVYGALSPFYVDYSSQLERFNYSLLNSLQSATIPNAFSLGSWTLLAYQPNYILNCVLNSSLLYFGIDSFNKDDIIQYNFSVKESVQGNYSLELFNDTGSLMETFPRHYTSASDNIIGTIDLAENFNVGHYYLRVKWNDTSTSIKTLRHGSKILEFYIINGTNAQFTVEVAQVNSGETATFQLDYTTYLGYGIENANIMVYENSTGTVREWGRAWTGSYEVGEITYLGNGEYSIPLFTEGASNGTYPIFFVISKYLHRTQVLQTNLKIIAVNQIEFDIVSGAYLDVSEWVISSDNIPYVNDSVNSIIRVNLTDSGIPITGGLVIGTIGETENYFEAFELGGGLYDLTLDTTGLNASLKSGDTYLNNETVEIRCSASGYDIKIEYVTLYIDKIPTSIHLQQVDPVYAQGSISLVASMENNIDARNPEPNNFGDLIYYIQNESITLLSGNLNLLFSGVYENLISIENLSPGNYTVYVNGTAINCENSQSNIINLEILPQESTLLQITLPSTIRILKQFQIKSTLSYAVNGTRIANQAVFFNISLGTAESFVVSTITNTEGISTYEYIIPSEYKGENITIRAIYDGENNIEGTFAILERPILGKIPIFLNIDQFPSSLRVGYSAHYGLRINITEGGETLQNRIILFSAYYGSDLDLPFYTDQLYTDENGRCEYLITELEDGENNITVFFEYLGSTSVSYNITSRFDTILPKWGSNFTLDPLPTTFRFGQNLEFSLQLFCENDSISLENLQVSFTFRYATTIESYIELINSNNTLIYYYRIADSFSGDLNYTITFLGTNKIESYSISLLKSVSPKIQVQLDFLQNPQNQYLFGTYPFEVRVRDELGNPLDGLLVVFEILDANDNIISNSTALCENGVAVASLDLDLGDNYKIRVRFNAESYFESASIISGNIRVVNEFLLFLDLLPMIGIAAGIVAGTGFTVHRAVIVPKRRRREESLRKLYQKLSDVENIQYVLILTHDGIPCFSKSLADVPIDETLISGFLSAIGSFGKEIGTKITSAAGGLEELSYRQFKIILNEGKYTRVALLLLKRPSPSLKEKLRKFNNAFEDLFEEKLQNFKGEVFADAPVTKLIEEIFEADLLYPHQVVDSKVSNYLKSSTSNDLDKKILVVARSEEFESNFYLRDLINHLKTKGIEEIESFESIQKLKSDKIVFAINVRTNYLIAEFQKYIKFLEREDRDVLFAIFDDKHDVMSINKYLKRRNLTSNVDVPKVIDKLKRLHMIDDNMQTTEIGNAVATLLKLIPDL